MPFREQATFGHTVGDVENAVCNRNGRDRRELDLVGSCVVGGFAARDSTVDKGRERCDLNYEEVCLVVDAHLLMASLMAFPMVCRIEVATRPAMYCNAGRQV